MFRVELPNGHRVLVIFQENAFALHRILPGDKVLLEMSLRFVEGRIVFGK